MPIDYSKNTYCRHCGITRALGLIRCPECNQRLRIKGNSNLARQKRNQEVVYID